MFRKVTLLLSVVLLAPNVAPAQQSPTRAREAREQARRQILAALQTEVSVEFIALPLIDALDELSALGRLPIWIDGMALEDEGIATDEPITLTAADVSIEQVLHLVLPPLYLDWIVEDEVLKITAQVKAEETLETRVYDVRDLLARLIPAAPTDARQSGGGQQTGGGFFQLADNTGFGGGDVGGIDGGGGEFGGAELGSGYYGGGYASADYSAEDHLADLLYDSTSGPWMDVDGVGGKLTIVQGMLSVRQSQRTHRQVARLLSVLDRATAGRLEQPSVAVHREHYPFEQDAAVEAALDTKLDWEYLDMPLADVVDHLRSETGLRAYLDVQALSDEGIATDEPITLTVEDISVRSALRLILQPLGATAIIEEGFLRITTEVAAEELLTTTVYDVAGLASDLEQRRRLSEAIHNGTSVAWIETNGVGGTLNIAADNTLVVRQTGQGQREVSYLLGELLRGVDGREAQPEAEQAAAEPAQEMRYYAVADAQTAQEAAGILTHLVAPGQWDDATLVTKIGRVLVVRQTPEVHQQVSEFVEHLADAQTPTATRTPVIEETIRAN